VKRDLPVFCISARGYQKLCGRLQEEVDVDFFETVQETQLPALKEHCKELTWKDRATSYERFLTAASQLLTSLVLWISRGKQRLFPEDDVVRQKILVQDALNPMIMVSRPTPLEAVNGLTAQNLDGSGSEVTKTLDKVFKESLYKRFSKCSEVYAPFSGADHYAEHAASRARAKAPETLSKLHGTASPHPLTGKRQGAYFNTYRAICRRKGTFDGFNRYDLTTLLTQPIQDRLSSAWESCFTVTWDGIIKNMVTQCTVHLDKFHRHFKDHAAELHVSTDIMALLDSQQDNFYASLKGIETTATADLKSKQRRINREFSPVIAAAMYPVYELCLDERGKGCFKRVKTIMQEHVETEKET